jgi:hypothetical protein
MAGVEMSGSGRALVMVAALALGACGSRSDTVSDEELVQDDCARAQQHVQDQCATKCGGTPSPSASPQDANARACVDGCITEATKACEATATCRCSLALTKLASTAR